MYQPRSPALADLPLSLRPMIAPLWFLFSSPAFLLGSCGPPDFPPPMHWLSHGPSHGPYALPSLTIPQLTAHHDVLHPNPDCYPLLANALYCLLTPTGVWYSADPTWTVRSVAPALLMRLFFHCRIVFSLYCSIDLTCCPPLLLLLCTITLRCPWCSLDHPHPTPHALSAVLLVLACLVMSNSSLPPQRDPARSTQSKRRGGRNGSSRSARFVIPKASNAPDTFTHPLTPSSLSPQPSHHLATSPFCLSLRMALAHRRTPLLVSSVSIHGLTPFGSHTHASRTFLAIQDRLAEAHLPVDRASGLLSGAAGRGIINQSSSNGTQVGYMGSSSKVMSINMTLAQIPCHCIELTDPTTTAVSSYQVYAVAPFKVQTAQKRHRDAPIFFTTVPQTCADHSNTNHTSANLLTQLMTPLVISVVPCQHFWSRIFRRKLPKCRHGPLSLQFPLPFQFKHTHKP
jgi:hypothetical protein